MSAITVRLQWPGYRLRFLLKKTRSHMELEQLRNAAEVSFVPMEAVGAKGGLDVSQVRPREAVENGYTLFFDGDVLVAKITPCFENGKGALATGLQNGIGYGTTELHVLDSGPEIEPRFLFFVTIADCFRIPGEAAMKGAAGQKRVPDEFIQNYRINLPGITTQQEIADYLDDETARVDSLVAEKERMLTLLEEKRAALISRAVTRGLDPNAPLKPSGLDWLGDIPEHWKLPRLKQVAQVRGGLTLGKNYDRSNLRQWPYLRVANVQDGNLNLSNIATVNVPDSVAKSCLLKEGDVLMNEGGDEDKLGRGAVWHEEIEPCLHQNHVFCVRPSGKINSNWLNAWTSSTNAKHYFQLRAKRSTNLASISSTSVGELPTPVPPIEEQIAIVKHIDLEHLRLDKLMEEFNRSIILLK